MKFKKALFVEIKKDSIDRKYMDRLDKIIEKKIFLSEKSPEFKKELKDADCLLVDFGGITVNKEMINSAKNLKYIGVFATGYGRIDAAAAKAKKIPVTNLPGYSTESVAEFAITALLANLRGVEEGRKRIKSGSVSEMGIAAKEIRGKVFGVLGLGNIGTRVAELASGFGADVRYWSRTKKNVKFKYEDPDKLIQSADFLSLHFSINDGTRDFLNAKRVASLKKGAVVINLAPIELVNHKALMKRLAQKDLTYIIDHADELTKEELAEYTKYETCIVYPPIAYITDEAGVTRKEMFVSNIENFAKGKPSNVVNP